MKKIVGNTKVKENSFPGNLTIDDTEITKKSSIANNLNNFFVNMGLKGYRIRRERISECISVFKK